MLHHTTIGNGLAVTFIHGFTQTGQSWSPVLEQMDIALSATLIDAPGHGDSLNGKRSLTQTAADITEAMTPGVLVGYSMGARMALHVALQSPHTVTALVLISGTAGIDSDDERTTRLESDTVLASRIIDIGVAAFIEEWLALPMFARLTKDAANIPERLRNTAEGLADSLVYAGTGTQTPLWGSLAKLNMPVLLIAGELDHKFVAQATRMHELIPNSEIHIVKNAGHTVQLEQTEVFTTLLKNFITSGNSEK
jgi:2-succinyl-6-hydroxy-2,4-cyclohexadiene-1-carboxylate synthase